jgi:hypothetical protein
MNIRFVSICRLSLVVLCLTGLALPAGGKHGRHARTCSATRMQPLSSLAEPAPQSSTPR